MVAPRPSRHTAAVTSPSGVQPERVAALIERELETFAERHPNTRSLHERASASLLDGVPMNWMIRWAGT